MAFWSPFLGRNKSEYHRQAAHPVLEVRSDGPVSGGFFEHNTQISSPGRAAFQTCTPNVPVFPITFQLSSPPAPSDGEHTQRTFISHLFQTPSRICTRTWPDLVEDLEILFQDVDDVVATWCLLAAAAALGGSAGIISPMEMQHWESQLPANPTVAFWQGWTEKSCSDCP